jgi:rhomboid family protein
MFPLRDDNPGLATPVVTIAIIALNLLVWLTVQGMGGDPALSRSICAYGLIPGELLGRIAHGTEIALSPTVACVLGYGPTWYTPLTSMFLHGSWFHIVGNLWFLWIFGDNVEDIMGHGRFAVFYLLCGLAAAAMQMTVSPGSALPMVGASGAIGGVMGAYALQFPRARVLTLLILGIFVRMVWVPAWLMLGYWFFLQFVGGLPALGSQDGGVAFWAHIGGFSAGVALLYLFRDPRRLAAQQDLAMRG